VAAYSSYLRNNLHKCQQLLVHFWPGHQYYQHWSPHSILGKKLLGARKLVSTQIIWTPGSHAQNICTRPWHWFVCWPRPRMQVECLASVVTHHSSPWRASSLRAFENPLRLTVWARPSTATLQERGFDEHTGFLLITLQEKG
jgi:hypothetical protein